MARGPEDEQDEMSTIWMVATVTLRTAAGELFDIDTALRPNGNSGLLVTSLAHFEAYQTGRGSNTAWTWEWQGRHSRGMR